MALPLAPRFRPRLPDASRIDYTKPDEVKVYMASLVEALTVAIGNRAPINTAVGSRLFISPNGTTFEHTVDDAGAVVVTKKADPLP